MPRVLIIEDDAENRRVMAQFFRREDWKVLEANDGDAGLELALRDQAGADPVRFVNAKIEWLSGMPLNSRATATNEDHRRLRPRLRGRSNQRS